MKERDDIEDIVIGGRTILRWMLENRDINQNISHDFIFFNIMQFQVPLLKAKGYYLSNTDSQLYLRSQSFNMKTYTDTILTHLFT
jgi:hypothetical protein